MKCNASSSPGRRAFLKHSGLAAVGTWLAPLAGAVAREIRDCDPTHALHIRKAQVELAPGHRITTTTYDGQLPGPLLRATVGRRVVVDVHNETDTAERMNWHGQDVADETSLVPAHSRQRMEFTPGRPGLYLYHSGVIAAANLDAGLYSGQVGALLVEPASQPHRRDRECVVVLKDCEPSIHRTRHGCEVAYGSLTVNGRMPAFAEPLRINTGERVLIHVLNASATQSHTLALPGHSFEVTALDGNPVPSPASVQTLHLGPGERISALVEMNRPGGGWSLRGPIDATWDYTRFGSGTPQAPDETLALVLTRHEAARSGFNCWSINGTSFSTADPRPLLRVQHGRRYRLQIRNTTDEILPIHLQHHRLEIASIAGKATAGVLKDVVSVGAYQQVEVDFVADSRGPALFHCTRQLQKDFGLMALIEYA